MFAQSGVKILRKVLVVGRDDAGILQIHDDPRLQFIDTGKPILAASARNRGIEASDAELLIFLDSDCLPQPGWLQGHLSAQQAGHKVVSGSVLPAGDNYWHLTYNLTLFHQLLATNPAGERDFLATLNLSVHRSVIEQVGMMNPAINRVEDVDWTTRMRRAGIQPYFSPSAPVLHDHNRTNLRKVWLDCARSGYNMRTVRLQHDDLLQAPGMLRYPRLVWWLSPPNCWLGDGGRIIWQRPRMAIRFWHTLPAIYLTKIAWCWGAGQAEEPS